MLRGTGSNVYNASLAQALAGLGHEVHLLCQDRDAGALDWVDAVGGDGAGPGTVSVHVPDIGGMLPVYVHDHYDGFEVKTFGQLSDDELDVYLAANVTAVKEIADRVGGVDAALANHLVMGPVILARSGLEYAAKIHGSALEFTVKRDLERFLPYAREGLARAACVLVGSRHTATVLWETLEDESVVAKTRLGPPGVDVELFAPREREAAEGAVRSLANSVCADVRHRASNNSTELDGPPAETGFGLDPIAARAALEHFADAEGPRAVFVGKLIRTKGVDLLLAAWPLVAVANPGARLLIVGFGEAREQIEALWGTLAAGDIAAARAIAQAPGPQGDLKLLDAFLRAAGKTYAEAARQAAGTVSFAGRLEHDEVAVVLPAADAMVVPSTFPEAFGMVAAEAAATGALPVCADHSGLHEVAGELAARLEADVAGLVAFELDAGAVEAIAARLNAWLALPKSRRQVAQETLVETTRELWSWTGVAKVVIDASAGELGLIPLVPSASIPTTTGD